MSTSYNAQIESKYTLQFENMERKSFSNENNGTSIMDKFCGNCNYLNYDEGEQTVVYKIQGVKPHHICTKYNKQVLHLGFHPDICRCEECILEEIR